MSGNGGRRPSGGDIGFRVSRDRQLTVTLTNPSLETSMPVRIRLTGGPCFGSARSGAHSPGHARDQHVCKTRGSQTDGASSESGRRCDRTDAAETVRHPDRLPDRVNTVGQALPPANPTLLRRTSADRPRLLAFELSFDDGRMTSKSSAPLYFWPSMKTVGVASTPACRLPFVRGQPLASRRRNPSPVRNAWYRADGAGHGEDRLAGEVGAVGEHGVVQLPEFPLAMRG